MTKTTTLRYFGGIILLISIALLIAAFLIGAVSILVPLSIGMFVFGMILL